MTMTYILPWPGKGSVQSDPARGRVQRRRPTLTRRDGSAVHEPPPGQARTADQFYVIALVIVSGGSWAGGHRRVPAIGLRWGSCTRAVAWCCRTARHGSG